MIRWPTSLIREVSARRCVFFLGAGVSACAFDSEGKHPKTWKNFLDEACFLIPNLKEKKIIRKLIKEKNFLLALEGIREFSDNSEYLDFINKSFNNPSFKPDQLHACIHELDSRIVITTNFDRIYENYCMRTADSDAFKIINYYSKNLVDEIKSDNRLIIKAHGSIDDISKMIFTRSEYHKAKRDYSQFYEIIKAIFLTNTVVFIGCSLSDPDLLLILEEVKITGSSERSHYAVIKKNSMNKLELGDLKRTYNICALEYGPAHESLFTDLQDLFSKVEHERSIGMS